MKHKQLLTGQVYAIIAIVSLQNRCEQEEDNSKKWKRPILVK